MSPEQFVPDNDVLTDRASEDDRNYAEGQSQDHYDGIHTEHRPPHLNDENFSSTQLTGSHTEPRPLTNGEIPHGAMLDSMHVTNDTDGNFSFEQNVPPTVRTDNTMRAAGPFVPRPDLAYYIYGDYQWQNGPGQPLRSQAIAALDHNQMQSYDGNLYNWQPPQRGFNSHEDLYSNWSTSHLTPADPMSQGPTTDSWVFPPNPEEHPADLFRNVGGWDEIPADHNTTWASQIPDEDVRDTQQ
ncbi:hypothetical protein F5Y05DRAFT_148736 [Hypoxylon sp. FL0543]|nr:hypothetical protein F5Y05DRAFT_148736 [Hypoxylon sp. FL0543]